MYIQITPCLLLSFLISVFQSVPSSILLKDQSSYTSEDTPIHLIITACPFKLFYMPLLDACYVPGCEHKGYGWKYKQDTMWISKGLPSSGEHTSIGKQLYWM